MKNIAHIGVDPSNSFEVNKHIKIINTFVFLGGLFSLSFCIIALVLQYYFYSLTCLACSLIMVGIITLNKFQKYSLAKYCLLISIPLIIGGFHILFGPIGNNYYLLSAIVFLFFLFNKTWERVSMFILLSTSFFVLEFIGQDSSIVFQHPVFEYLYFINIIASFILTYIGLNLFFQEHMKNQKTIESHNQELLLKNRDIQNQNIIKDKLFSLISHDLKGPLRSLNALIDMLGNNYITAEQLREQLPNFSEKLNNTTNLVENLLTWTRTQLKGIKANPEKIELVTVINEIIELFEESLKKKNIMVDAHFSGSGTIITDKEMLRTILRNILHNAIKYSNINSKIFISMDSYGDHYLVVIKDEGTGMDLELIGRFNQNKELLSVEGTSGEKGTGLGLLIVKELIGEINGEINIDSPNDSGTIITLKLPTSM